MRSASTSGDNLIRISEHVGGFSQCRLVGVAIGTCGFGRSLEKKEVVDNPAVMKYSPRHLCITSPCTVCLSGLCYD